ncbi:MAG: hypothetical protein J07HQW1_03346 [Haloquadratum walsbyi J07HQW1]|uniref:Uncharacterized protein n=1 Tax=Haloquadratum walsbyi J07HQW1 TaxID=1238424 RepID=U1N954_9EURY|nr:MAG: hypothetical protein J07HQW1_03346 [Haloquadratum walsbyi J07HQW1]
MCESCLRRLRTTSDHFGPLRTRDSGVGDRGRRRPRTLVCAHRPKTQSGGHRSAIQVVFGQAVAGGVSRNSGVVFVGWRILEGWVLRGNDVTGAVSEEVVERYIEETEHAPE